MYIYIYKYINLYIFIYIIKIHSDVLLIINVEANIGYNIHKWGNKNTNII